MLQPLYNVPDDLSRAYITVARLSISTEVPEEMRGVRDLIWGIWMIDS